VDLGLTFSSVCCGQGSGDNSVCRISASHRIFLPFLLSSGFTKGREGRGRGQEEEVMGGG
jgi:hypothetical protein